MRAFDLAANAPWAITQDALETIMSIAAREHMDKGDLASLEAVAAKLGRPLDNTHVVTVRDGVATIPIEGPLFRHADMFSQISGATSIDALATDLRTALDDPAIQAIVLAIDSPGGEVNGTAEFADMVYAARGQKSITSYISDMGASAAYWIASAADEVVIAPTATVGSIGVIATARPPDRGGGSRASIEFVSSQSPDKRMDPTTTYGRTQIQALIDTCMDVFVAAVARNRGVSKATVLSDFGQGGVFLGQAAVTAGLADRIGSYEGVMSATMAALQAKQSKPPGWLGKQVALRAAQAHDNQKQGSTRMDGKEFFRHLFTGAKEAGVDFAGMGATDDAPPPPPPYTSSAEFVAAQRRAEDAEARIAAYEAQAYARADAERTATVSAAVERVLSAHKALPAARESLTSDFALAAEDDAARPVANGQPTRVARLEASYATNKAHPLTRELIADTHGVLPASAVMGTPDDEEIAKAVATAKAYAEQMNKAEANARAAKGGK